jgi:hypothetical protein
MDSPIAASTRHLDAPGIAANLAILNKASFDVWFDVDLDLLAAKRTGDEKVVRIHSGQVYRFAGTPQSDTIVLFHNTNLSEGDVRWPNSRKADRASNAPA